MNIKRLLINTMCKNNTFYYTFKSLLPLNITKANNCSGTMNSGHHLALKGHRFRDSAGLSLQQTRFYKDLIKNYQSS